MKMTNRLLAFARRQELEAGPEDVNALLGKLRLFLNYGAGPGIRVILELAPDLPRCLVDPPQFNSAILNLVVNARDAMPEGGLVRISTRASPTNADVKYVRVRVSDDGVGMPRRGHEENLRSLFHHQGRQRDRASGSRRSRH